MNTARPFKPTTTLRARSTSAAATCKSLTNGKKRRKETRAGFINTVQPERHLPQGLKPAFLHGVNGTAEEAAEKVVPDQTVPPQRLKPDSEQSRYRSAEALRHPKSSPRLSFSAACEAVPYPKPFMKPAPRGKEGPHHQANSGAGREGTIQV